ncbi:MAG TPA: hypothetical protein VD794_06440, partial [Flavisolibacter sp.]|nr:hypothetical protein [Flavisolibacter sp.]
RDPLYTDIHCPIVYNKQDFIKSLGRLDWSVPYGYCIKTVYCRRALSATTFHYCPDLKIEQPLLPYARIIHQLAGRPWFSIGEAARQGDLLQVLNDLYTLPSKYEKL